MATSPMDVQASAIIHQQVCPSCQQQTTFRFIGVQRWSERIARANNMPTEQRLYACQACESSISEASLHKR